jgi:hypothetical protein
VSEAEIAGLLRFVDMAQKDGDSFEEGIRVALEAMLVSPQCLFHIERDPNPNSPEAVHRLTDFDLASRLSYFLWSSMPDDELFGVAESGNLHKPAVLSAQVERMLKDPKSSRLVENFAGQWLELRNLDSVKPDPKAVSRVRRRAAGGDEDGDDALLRIAAQGNPQYHGLHRRALHLPE